MHLEGRGVGQPVRCARAGFLRFEVQNQRTSKGDVDELVPAADPQDGHLALERQASQPQVELLAVFVEFYDGVGGLVAVDRGRVVQTTDEEQAADGGENRAEVAVGRSRDQERDSATELHRCDVAPADTDIERFFVADVHVEADKRFHFTPFVCTCGAWLIDSVLKDSAGAETL